MIPVFINPNLAEKYCINCIIDNPFVVQTLAHRYNALIRAAANFDINWIFNAIYSYFVLDNLKSRQTTIDFNTGDFE